MGRINVKSVIVGGLVAGLVLNVIDYLVYGVWLAPELAQQQKPGQPSMESLIPLFVLLDFVYGIALVQLYAAIRPRFGAGPATAVKAGVAMWFVLGLLSSLYMWPMQLMPQGVMITSLAVSLVGVAVAAVAGAKFYTEGAAVGSGMGAGMGARM